MKVTRFRLSCVWVEGVPQVLGRDDLGPLGNLVRADDYQRRFAQLLTSDDDPLVTIPWPRKAGQTFPGRNNYWNEYIVQTLRDHRSEPGYKAWRAAVPLRHKAPLVAPARDERSFVEGWYYPHGVGLTVTAWFSGEYDGPGLESAVDAFMRDDLAVRWPDRPDAVTTTVDALADDALTALRTAAFGAVEAGFRPAPLRILTLIAARADQGESDPAAAEKPVVAAALSAAGAPTDGSLKPSRDVYSFPRGNVTWRADRALSALEKVHTLGCLHRNLTMAALQVASLVRCAQMLNGALDDTQNRLPARVAPYASAVATLIARLYGGAQTYDSPSVRERIATANEHGEIDAFLAKLGLPKLYLPKAQ